MNKRAAFPDQSRSARAQLLLRASLTLVVSEESSLRLSSERLEVARRLHPEGLLSSLQLQEIVQEYVLAKNRSESALDTLRSNWLSLRMERSGRADGWKIADQ